MAKKCLIYETLDAVKKMDVSRDELGLMQLSGVFGVCGVRNNNHRVYETQNYKAMVLEMQERIKRDGAIAGELEHPSTMNVDYNKASHKITKIDIDENGVVTGTISLLNTDAGRNAQAIVEGGLPLYVSSRAQGTVDAKGNVKLEQLQTYDLVGSPGFSQAKLHLNESVVCESLDGLGENDSQFFYVIEGEVQQDNIIEQTENKEIENNELEMKELQEALERIEALEAQVESLQEQKQQNIDVENLANGIEQWIKEEYTPELADKIENWVVEQYSPEIEKWVVESFAPEIEKWVVESFAPEIEKWVVEQYSPEIEKWVVNEYSEGVNEWFNGEKAELTESLTKSLTESFQNAINESKKNSLSSIDETLKLLEESAQTVKPTYKRIVESEEPKFIAEMPEASRVKWNLATEEVKESIKRRASIYNFTKNTIENFWESVNWDMTPSKTVYEGVNQSQDLFEQQLRARFRRKRVGEF